MKLLTPFAALLAAFALSSTSTYAASPVALDGAAVADCEDGDHDDGAFSFCDEEEEGAAGLLCPGDECEDEDSEEDDSGEV